MKEIGQMEGRCRGDSVSDATRLESTCPTGFLGRILSDVGAGTAGQARQVRHGMAATVPGASTAEGRDSQATNRPWPIACMSSHAQPRQFGR